MNKPTSPKNTEVYLPEERYPEIAGLYHWSTYWRCWDKIISADGDMWVTVVTVDMHGNPLPYEAERTHRTMMEAWSFSDKPFNVTRG